MLDTNDNEKVKYEALYEDVKGVYRKLRDARGYGHVNHGKKLAAREVINVYRPVSILDVGCGCGEFCIWAAGICKTVYGLDFASVEGGYVVPHNEVVYINASASAIPLPDNSVEFITSFDCLEHCILSDINKVFEEFYRVATKGFLVSIAYRQANEKSLKGENLHMTVKSEKWWIRKIKAICYGVQISKVGVKGKCLLCLFG